MRKLSRFAKYSPGLYGLPHMGEVIADYRVKAGWKSQETFAIVCGVDKQTVTYWENQEYLTDMERRIFLCRALKISPALLGLTWRSVVDEKKINEFFNDVEQMIELLEENSYGLYEDILTFSHAISDKYSNSASYTFNKHREELERLTKYAPEAEKESWQDLLCRYYQHATFIAQHRKEDAVAISHINHAVTLASSLNDRELLGASLYRRARVFLVQSLHQAAKEDIQAVVNNTERLRGPLKGSSYLLSAEVHSLYAQGDEKLKVQCRKWQDMAGNLIYKGKVEDDGTFIMFDLYAVHHERAKVLSRFSLYHTSDDELVEILQGTHVRANAGTLRDAHTALATAKSYMEASQTPQTMNFSITEARIHLIGKDFETSAKTAKAALGIARTIHSQRGVEEVKKIYNMLIRLASKNPYVSNLGIELGFY